MHSAKTGWVDGVTINDPRKCLRLLQCRDIRDSRARACRVTPNNINTRARRKVLLTFTWREPWLVTCPGAVSWKRRCIRALSDRHLPLAATSCLSGYGTEPVRLPAAKRDAFRPWDECGRSPYRSAEYIPDIARHGSSCELNRCRPVRRPRSCRCFRPLRIRPSPFATECPSDEASALWLEPHMQA